MPFLLDSNRSKAMKNKTVIGALIALIALVFVALFCVWVGKNIYEGVRPAANEQPALAEQTLPARVSSVADAERVYLAFGNPSSATADISNYDNYLIVKNAYALSYNNSRGTPNWVAWRVTQADLGDVERQNDFRPDPDLPIGFRRVTPDDYSASGFDRGHLCPSADRSSDAETNSLTFLMTNIAPQTGDLNRYPWEKLESYSRTLVRRGHVDLFIIAGVYGDGGKLKRKITIPTNFWKIIISVPQGGGPG